MKLYKELFLTNRFFYVLAVIAALYAGGLMWMYLYFVAHVFISVFAAAVIFEFWLLFSVPKSEAYRETAERFSNGDENTVTIKYENPYGFSTKVTVIDEAPEEFQLRDISEEKVLEPGQNAVFSYEITPGKRGQFSFGRILVYYQSPLQLLERVMISPQNQNVKVYPAFKQLPVYELMALHDKRFDDGTRQVRAESVALEFDQIREYNVGDDPKTVNWAATARRNKLMVNQFTEERSQPVYSVIDMGRIMKMPFAGMTLLDYAINASLALSKVALVKYDKPGLITFSDSIKNVVKADSGSVRMSYLMEALYHQRTNFQESNMQKMYAGIRRILPSRSTLILFTNFETELALRRALPILKNLDQRHLLLVVLFRNTEVEAMHLSKSQNIQDVYDKAIAEENMLEKEHINRILIKSGIKTLLTSPSELSIQAVNKYLQIKKMRLV